MAVKTIAQATVSKRAIAETVAHKLDMHPQSTLKVIQAFLDQIVEEMGAGRRLEFRDFGVFEMVARQPRKALNPRTLEPVQVQQKVVVKFKPGRLMKENVLAYGERRKSQGDPDGSNQRAL